MELSEGRWACKTRGIEDQECVSVDTSKDTDVEPER